MGYSFEKLMFLFCLILAVTNSELAEEQDVCTEESSCSLNGPTIRFPFRLKDKQPSRCGYPGFELSCSKSKRAVLELPNSVKLYVRKIDYKSQVLQVHDPDKCLFRSLANLTLSTSPFQFSEINLSNYTLFNCTTLFSRYTYSRSFKFRVPCLSSSSGHPVYVVHSPFHMGWANFSSCTKMYNIRSVPSEIQSNKKLLLSWFKPNCTNCEAAGKKCRLKSNGTLETECYGKLLNRSKVRKTKLWIAISVLGSHLVVLTMIILYRIYRAAKADKQHLAKIEKFLEDYKALKPARYNYADIKRITDNFKEKLGQGSYGTVFKGKLSNEIFVAVKILNDSKGNGEEFINEMRTIGRIHHVNVVRFVGYCADGFRRALIYEFLTNESLDKFIFSRNVTKSHHVLCWEKLLDIALGVAKGIEYLHQGCEQRILHFDIKPHNVLLDENFNPKISDFGLAKLCSKDQSAVPMTAARGTMGYIAPEVLSRNFGNVSHKSDVYSFGILLLEMLGGRKNTVSTPENTGQVYFPERIYERLKQEDIIEEDGDADIAKKLTIVGLWCIQWNPIDRPSMKVVVQMLGGEVDNLPVPPNPFASPGNKRMEASAPERILHQELEVISEAD